MQAGPASRRTALDLRGVTWADGPGGPWVGELGDRADPIPAPESTQSVPVVALDGPLATEVTFLASLVDRNRVEALALLRLLEGHGNRLRPPQSKPLDGGLFELRGHQVRIFYVFRPSGSTGS